MEAGGWQGGGGEAPLRPGEGEVSPLPPPSGSRILPAPSASSRALGVPGGVFVFFFFNILFYLFRGSPAQPPLCPHTGFANGPRPKGLQHPSGSTGHFSF